MSVPVVSCLQVGRHVRGKRGKGKWGSGLVVNGSHTRLNLSRKCRILRDTNKSLPPGHVGLFEPYSRAGVFILF